MQRKPLTEIAPFENPTKKIEKNSVSLRKQNLQSKI